MAGSQKAASQKDRSPDHARRVALSAGRALLSILATRARAVGGLPVTGPSRWQERP